MTPLTPCLENRAKRKSGNGDDVCGSALAHYMVVDYTRRNVRTGDFRVERLTRTRLPSTPENPS